MADRPFALIVGVGGATGRAVCERFGASHRLAMVARSRDVTEELAARLPEARAYASDVSDAAHWAATLTEIEAEFGKPDRILFNVERAAWGDYNELDLEVLADSFGVNVLGLMVLVRTLYPSRAAITKPCRLLVSSSPAAYGSAPLFLGTAPSRAAQRVVAETLHAMLSEHGLSLGVLSIAGMIDEPGMRSVYPDAPDEAFIRPEAIAERVFDLFAADAFPERSEITKDGSDAQAEAPS